MPPVVVDLRRSEDTRDVVHRAVQALAEGRIVAFPTETVYGIGASACHPEAVQRLVEAKGRSATAPLAVAIKSAEEAIDYVPDMNPLARRLARRCWPGPVTLVVDDAHQAGLATQLPPAVQKLISPNGTLGLRVPANQMLQDVLRMVAGPIVLTSANRSGEPDAVTAAEVVEALGDHVALVLDDGPCRYGQPSTVARVKGRKVEILREGVVAAGTLERLACVMVLFVCTGNTCRSPMAAALLRRQLAARLGCPPEEVDQHGVLVLSAGVATSPGAPAAAEAQQVIGGLGLDLSRHESQPLTEQLVRHADLILAMTRSHRLAIVERWPGAADRIRTHLSTGEDVSDPIGGPIDVYRQCAAQLDAGIAAILTEIEEQVAEF